ncbi:DinB family protein [Cryptosporangium sp. NPDC048952]|uniref:DinB family protein n=1 Tax=Cryptosporangium sp. NPDC048952 TaxID=3363961 RepID=UPI003721A51D
MSDEKAVLSEFLAYQRESVEAIVAGLDEEALGTAVLPSGWTPLGLIEHLGDAEMHWFQDVFTGSRVEGEASSGLAFYREQCRISDTVIAAASLDTAPARRHESEPLASQTTDLRRIILHLIEETARHAGHLDAARELLDGRTGLGPR